MSVPARRSARLLERVRLEYVLIALCAWLSFNAPNFFTLDNLLNVLRAVALQGIIAFGMTLVILVGEIDLSVGANVAFSGCLIAYLTSRGIAIPLGAAITLSVGALAGLFTGQMRARFGVPSFITTLALLTGFKGAAQLVTGRFTLTPFPRWYEFFGGGYVAGIPFPALVFFAAFGLFHLLAGYTQFGRSIYAVGGNAEASRLAGIPVARIRALALMLTSILAALSGILLSSRTRSGSPTAGQGWELDIIAAVIIGGTSLSGGRGTIWGTFVGVVFIGVIVNGMILLNIPSDWQYVVRGALILAAVLLNSAQKSAAGGRN